MLKNKKLIFIAIIIALVLSIIIKNNGTSQKKINTDEIMYAINVDGKIQNNFPSRGLYKVKLECTNAKCIWDYDEWMLRVRNISGEVSCNISFNTIIKTYLNNKAIGLAGTTQGIGQVVNENGYRYEGKNPNNWVWFNNELWRIIGVFDSNTHGVENTNLVKIVRANPIGKLTWNTISKNDWSNSSLYNLLNGVYYNKQNGTGNAYCYLYQKEVPGNCDYRIIGIDTSYRKMIKRVTWKLGGHTTTDATAETFYTAERGKATGNNNEYASEKDGYIGLMYPSDYGYSVLSSSCSRTTNLSFYDSSWCAGKSWLYYQGDEMTLTPFTNNNNVFALGGDGVMYDSWSIQNFKVRPTLYLNENVYVLDGTGSEADPYIIGMDEVSE